MSESDKQARRAVRDYLAAIESVKPKRGRKRTPESIDKRLAAIAEIEESVTALKRLELAQERIELTNEREQLLNTPDLAGLEAGFIAHAAEYGEAKGITYAAWREVGVQAETLSAAGIKR